MKTIFKQIIVFLITLIIAPSVLAYKDITTVELHNRLVHGDTLLLLDVREISEYQAGHIAEPPGQLPLTPVNLPWSSNVLSAEYERLPRDIDIVVYCRSGGRSAGASQFLQNKGFTRIINMIGGFNSWTYQRRDGSYGDHSGQWIYSTNSDPVEITCLETEKTSKIIFPSAALPGINSLYVELHFVSDQIPVPPNVPVSDINGLFRLTALDQFGISQFVGDSLVLPDSVKMRFFPHFERLKPEYLVNQNMTCFIPDQGWQSVSFNVESLFFTRNETVIRRWYNIEGFVPTGVAMFSQPKQPEVKLYPNPFNSSIKIIAEPNSAISIYDIKGRKIKQLDSQEWHPNEFLSSGIYFINIESVNQRITKQVVYLK
ncbi:T9SS type A sorting domain-containing protein [candidate division KSB1 bacterium]|nr:T9SS type A sorting domain-containing protein [candidate division KSB1 bacterium]